jgi:hypothetical protein
MLLWYVLTCPYTESLTLCWVEEIWFHFLQRNRIGTEHYCLKNFNEIQNVGLHYKYQNKLLKGYCMPFNYNLD